MPSRTGNSSDARSLRSDLGSKDPTTMNYVEFSKWRKEQDTLAGVKYPNGGKEWEAHIDQMFKTEELRDKNARAKEKAEKAARKAERDGAKDVKLKEKNRVEGLAKSLVYEMEPYEIALSQRIYDDAKNEQKVYDSKVDKSNGALLLGEQDERGLPKGFYPPEYTRKINIGRAGESEEARRLEPHGDEGGLQRWLTKDKDASDKLVQDLRAKGEQVVRVPMFGEDYLIKTVTEKTSKYNDATKQWEAGEQQVKYALPIAVYKKDPKKNDQQIANEADQRAKEVIHSFSEKLIDKTEGIAGKGTQLVGKPKVKMSGSDPWGQSTVEIAMGDKKVTWKTKMIWNRSVNNKSFNQWPTRLQDTETI